MVCPERPGTDCVGLATGAKDQDLGGRWVPVWSISYIMTICTHPRCVGLEAGFKDHETVPYGYHRGIGLGKEIKCARWRRQVAAEQGVVLVHGGSKQLGKLVVVSATCWLATTGTAAIRSVPAQARTGTHSTECHARPCAR